MKKLIGKIKLLITARKKAFLCLCAGGLVLAISAVAVVMAVASRNSTLPTDGEPTGTIETETYDGEYIDQKGYDTGEYTLPEGFGELTQIEETTTPDDEPAQTPAPIANTGLPALYITTESGKAITSRTTYTAGGFKLDAPSGSRFDSIGDTAVSIRGRGHSTWNAAKKPYRLKFDQRVSICGLTPSRDYVLLANAYDKSHIRNSVAFAAARVLSFGFVPTAVHVEVYLNGEYKGLYTVGNSVSQTASVSNEGFLIEIGGWNYTSEVENVDYFQSTIIKGVGVRKPTPRTNLTAAQMNYIRDYCRETDKAVAALENYEDYIDMRSLIDYFLLTELLFNLDGTFSRSTYLIKEPDSRLKVASVWDFDLAMGNYTVDRNQYNTWACVRTSASYFQNPTWIDHLIKDPAFQYAVRERWEQIGTRMYNAAIAEITRNRAFLGNAVTKNNQTWPPVKSIHENSAAFNNSTWTGQVTYIETFLGLRYKWLKEQIATFPATLPDGSRDIMNPVAPTPATTPETTPETTPVITPATTPVTTPVITPVITPVTTPAITPTPALEE